MKRTISGWILAVVILLSAWSAAGVFAYFTGGDRITNRIGVGYNDVEIREEFPDPDPEDEEITKKVSFVNTGPVDCFARAKLVFGSQEAEDAVRMQMNGGQWKQEADGYYYYQKTLAPGEETEELLLALNVEGEISQEEKEFDLTVYVETVQALAGEDPLTAFSRLTK